MPNPSTAWRETARLLRELDSTGRKMLGMIGEGLSILTRQPWPALNQTSQLEIVCIQGRIQLGSNNGFRLSIPTNIESSIAHRLKSETPCFAVFPCRTRGFLFSVADVCEAFPKRSDVYCAGMCAAFADESS